MAAPSTNSIFNLPGTLVWGPTNLSAAYPYGGTELGTTKENSFEPNVIIDELWLESPGVVGNAVYGGERPVLKAILTYPDNDAIQKIMAYSTAGAAGNYRVWGSKPAATAGTAPGVFLASNSGVLLFSPHAATKHPALLMYNAIPMPDAAARIKANWNDEYTLAVAFWGSMDSSGRSYLWGQVGDLSL